MHRVQGEFTTRSASATPARHAAAVRWGRSAEPLLKNRLTRSEPSMAALSRRRLVTAALAVGLLSPAVPAIAAPERARGAKLAEGRRFSPPLKILFAALFAGSSQSGV